MQDLEPLDLTEDQMTQIFAFLEQRELKTSSTLHVFSGLECPQLFQWMDWERRPEDEKNLNF